jgi:hypothetical protein
MTKKTHIMGCIDKVEIKNGWVIFDFVNQRNIFEERGILFDLISRCEHVKIIRFPADTRFIDEVVNDILKGKKYRISGFYNTFPKFSPHSIEYSGLLTTPDGLNMPPKKSEKDFFFYGKESPGYKSLKSEFYLKKTDLRVPLEEFERILGITEIRDDTKAIGSMPAYFPEN